MWWGNSSDKDPKAAAKETPAETSKNASAKDASNREKLPPAMQRIVERSEKEENYFDELVDG